MALLFVVLWPYIAFFRGHRSKLIWSCSLRKKERLRVTIFRSAETVHFILLCHLGDAITCALSADLKMVTRNHPLEMDLLHKEL